MVLTVLPKGTIGLSELDDPQTDEAWRAAIIQLEFREDMLGKFAANSYMFVPVKEVKV